MPAVTPTSASFQHSDLGTITYELIGEPSATDLNKAIGD
ncbi:MAG: hypothetical protein RLZZ624_297, partial [Cyanobacteriota bacterium]